MSLPKYENVFLLQTWLWRLHKLKNVMLRSKQNKTSYIVGNKHMMQTNCIWTLMLVKITVSYMRQHYLMEPYMYTGESFLWSWLAGSLLSVNSAAVSSPLVGSTGSYSFAFTSLSGREPVSDSDSTSASGLKKKRCYVFTIVCKERELINSDTEAEKKERKKSATQCWGSNPSR